jgi:hypothetical protein
LTITKPQNATLIDTISEGYAAINRRPWLVLVPILLNVYLWFGAQLSFGPLIESFHGWLRQLPAAEAQPSDLQLRYDQLLSFSQVDMRQPLAVMNVIPTLALSAIGSADQGLEGQGVPLVSDMPRLIDASRTDTIRVSTIPGALLAFLAINALSLALSALFLNQVGSAVRRDGPPIALGLRQAGRVALSILGYVGIVGGIALALGLPLFFFIAVLLYLNFTLGLFAAELLFVLWFWIKIYIGFAPEAIVMNGNGPLRAIYTSFNIVRRNFWATLGFLVLTWVIAVGCGVIWQQLAGSTVGLVVAIVGSAYVGSGLLAARMAFFRERLRRWQTAPVVKRPAA